MTHEEAEALGKSMAGMCADAVRIVTADLRRQLATEKAENTRLRVAVRMVAKQFCPSGDDDLTAGERQSLSLCREAAQAAEESGHE